MNKMTEAANTNRNGKVGMGILMWVFGIPIPLILLYWVACN